MRNMLVRISVIACCSLLAAIVFACTPREALAYKSPELAAAQAKLLAAEARVRAQSWNVSGTIDGNRREGENAYEMALHWSRSRVEVAEAAHAVDTAQHALTQLSRDATRQALLAHAGLWESQAGARATALRLETAKLRVAETKRRLEAGAVPQLEAETATLDHAEAVLAERRAQGHLKTARLEAGRFALAGEAEPVLPRFAVKEIAAEELAANREAKWTVLLAKQRLEQARQDVAPAVGLEATYLTRNMLWQSNVTSRGPGIDITTQYPSTNLILDPQFQNGLLALSNGWQFMLKADLPLNPSAYVARRAAAAEWRAAQARQDEIRRTQAVQLAQARAEVEATADALLLAEARAALDVRRVSHALEREKIGTISRLDVLDEQAKQAEDEAKHAVSWKEYLNAVGAYLELIDGTWEEIP